jgi:hypothetical protein
MGKDARRWRFPGRERHTYYETIIRKDISMTQEEAIKEIAIAKIRELILLANPNFEIENPDFDWSSIETCGPADAPQRPADLECLDGSKVWEVNDQQK